MSFDPVLVEQYAEGELRRLSHGFDSFRESGTLDRKLIEDMDADQRMILIYDKMKAKLAIMRDSLPDLFNRRVSQYRQDRNWRWKYEAYEIFCMKESLEISERFGRIGAGSFIGMEGYYLAMRFAADTIRAVAKMESGEILSRFPFLDKIHTGTSLAYTLELAAITCEDISRVTRWHGALASIIGCDAYGCHRPIEGEFPAPAMEMTVLPILPFGDHDETHNRLRRNEFVGRDDIFTRARRGDGTIPRLTCGCSFCFEHGTYSGEISPSSGCRCGTCAALNAIAQQRPRPRARAGGLNRQDDLIARDLRRAREAFNVTNR